MADYYPKMLHLRDDLLRTMLTGSRGNKLWIWLSEIRNNRCAASNQAEAPDVRKSIP
jgi:hypothetical protein